jgi:hypothetical protein
MMLLAHPETRSTTAQESTKGIHIKLPLQLFGGYFVEILPFPNGCGIY